MIFTYTMTVEVNRDTGKFISREEIAGEIEQALIDADPGQIDVDDSIYFVIDWAVDEVPQPSKRRSAS